MSKTLLAAAGLPVADEEWQLIRRKHRAAVLSFAARKYGVTPDAVPDYWQTPLPDGKTPENLLADRAAGELLSIKKAQQVMLAQGVIPDAGFDAFLSGWKRENERRKALLSRGEPIYGPKFFPMDEYYFHLHRLRLDAARELLRQNCPVPEDTLSRWYDDHREEMPEFRRPDTLIVEVCTTGCTTDCTTDCGAACGADGGAEGGAARENTSRRNEILVLTGEDAHHMQSIYDEVNALRVGESSEVFLTPEGRVQYRLIERKGGEYPPFSEIRPLIERRYYEAMLREEIRRIPDSAVFSD